MIRVEARSNEPLEKMLRRFKRRCEKEGLANDFRDRQYYTPPSLKNHQDGQRRKKRFEKEKREKENERRY
jgi:small subunit ribosomal protein S21